MYIWVRNDFVSFFSVSIDRNVIIAIVNLFWLQRLLVGYLFILNSDETYLLKL